MCAASIERAAEHWFDSGPVVDAVVASAAVPGLLPPAKVGDEHYLDGGIVNSIPLGRAVAARGDPGLRAPGRPDRPAADACRKRPWEVARVSFEIARRHRFTPRAGRAARRRRGARPARARHVEPRRHPARHRDFAGVQERIDATYDASRGLPRRAPVTGPASLRPALRRWRRAGRRRWPVLLWVTLPLWLIAAAALSPLLPGRLRALRLLWVVDRSTSTCEALLLVVMFGLWLASGFGWRLRTAVLRGHPLRPGRRA